MHKQYDVIILGAGASGLMCAATAAERGQQVLILDHSSRAGRKIAVAGGGKANITNLTMTPSHFVSHNMHFTRSALERFTPPDLMEYARSATIPLEEREHGQIFCKRTAEDIVNLLRSACAPCTFFLPATVGTVLHNTEPAPHFTVQVGKHTTVSAPSQVVATGSSAWPQIGASSFGLQLARQFGHSTFAFQPALVGLQMPENWQFSGLSGISFDTSISVSTQAAQPEEQPAKSRREKGSSHPYAQQPAVLAATNLPLLFTHKGISGPAALQASLYWEQGSSLTIDWLPAIAMKETLMAPEHGKLLVKNLLKRFFPARFAQRIVPPALGERKVGELPATQRALIAETCNAHMVTPTGTEGFRKAEAARGGVDTKDISSKSMESRLIPGLFFCGEVLDVTGRLGGYNLHWAFASGKAAGEYV